MKILVSPSSFGKCGDEPLEILESSKFEIIHNPYGRKLTENEVLSLGSDNLVGIVTHNDDCLILSKSTSLVFQICRVYINQ